RHDRPSPPRNPLTHFSSARYSLVNLGGVSCHDDASFSACFWLFSASTAPPATICRRPSPSRSDSPPKGSNASDRCFAVTSNADAFQGGRGRRAKRQGRVGASGRLS